MTDRDAPLTVRQRFGRALFWSVVTGAFFILVYGQTNAHAARLAAAGVQLPTVAFSWERHLPIVPAFIIPYMSIDLFFAFSPLLCITRRQMDRHAMRLLTVIAVAGLFFWFVPLEYAFERPKVEGLFAPVFTFLHGFDAPHNLAPSLHIALRSLLWVVYVRATTGLLRAGVQVWFIAIGVSTVLVGQHHVIDLVTGQFLAMWCLHLLPDRSPIALPTHTNHRVGMLYLLGGTVFIASGVLLGGLGLFLAWPAYALLIVSSGYFGAGPAVFRKIDGRLTRSAQWVLGPYLLGAWLNWRLTRSDAAINAVTPTLLVGRKLGTDELPQLDQHNVQHVVDLTAEFSAPRLAGRTYLSVPVVDLVVPTVEQLNVATQYYLDHRALGPVLVACGLGYSRSACTAAACLLASGEARHVDQAIEMIRHVRRVELGNRHRAVLESFAKRRSAH